MNKARANAPRLIPLKEQAATAIREAQAAIETNTRPYSIRRRLAEATLNRARREYRDGAYLAAITTARSAV